MCCLAPEEPVDYPHSPSRDCVIPLFVTGVYRLPRPHTSKHKLYETTSLVPRVQFNQTPRLQLDFTKLLDLDSARSLKLADNE